MKLASIELSGFKSIRQMEPLPVGELTVLLGSNGSGKSNLLSFLHLLPLIAKLKSEGTSELDQKINLLGGPSTLLHYGPKVTSEITYELAFSDQNLVRGSIEYAQNESPNYTLSHPSPAAEQWMRGVQYFQFHDTSPTAAIKLRGYRDDAHHLHKDGGNLAAFLANLKSTDDFKKYYDRIMRQIRSVVPQFNDFDLRPLPGHAEFVKLNWRNHSASEYLLGPHQLSDGSLRFMALACLLLQPPELLPSIIVLDEPELGLHPVAIQNLAGMIHIAAQHSQIILATQSTNLIDHFEPEQIVITEWDTEHHSTIFKRLDREKLESWLQDYSIAELWEKNVLGGQP